MKSVLSGFLGTYVSRYSDFDGYLLFGFVVAGLSDSEIDLAGPVSPTPTKDPALEFQRLARLKFQEQLAKVGLPLSVIRAAVLRVEKGPLRQGGVMLRRGVTLLPGNDLRFTARVVTDLGRQYQEEAVAFVAPQDPRLFVRSDRTAYA